MTYLSGVEVPNPVEVEFIYFIQEGSTGPIKIGRARQPYERLKGLQTCCPHKLEMRRTVLVHPSIADKLEKRLHKHFDAARIRGEWFEPTPELLAMATRKVDHGRSKRTAVSTP